MDPTRSGEVLFGTAVGSLVRDPEHDCHLRMVGEDDD